MDEAMIMGGRGRPLGHVCTGTKRNGGRCTVSVERGQTFCHHHDPARASERGRAASRAGKSKPSRGLQHIKRKLSELADDVLSGNVDRGVAGVASQIFNVYLRALSFETKLREVEELEHRVSELRARIEEIGRSRWGD